LGNGLPDFNFKDISPSLRVGRFPPRRDGEISVRRFLPRRDGGKRRTGGIIGVIGRNGGEGGRIKRPPGLVAVLPSGLKLDILFI